MSHYILKLLELHDLFKVRTKTDQLKLVFVTLATKEKAPSGSARVKLFNLFHQNEFASHKKFLGWFTAKAVQRVFTVNQQFFFVQIFKFFS